MLKKILLAVTVLTMAVSITSCGCSDNNVGNNSSNMSVSSLSVKATEKSTEKLTEKATETVTEKATQKITEKTTERSTERATQKPTEKSNKKSDKKDSSSNKSTSSNNNNSSSDGGTTTYYTTTITTGGGTSDNNQNNNQNNSANNNTSTNVNNTQNNNQDNNKSNNTSETKTWHEAEYKTVSHPAETKQVWVVDKESYTYEEPVYEKHDRTLCNDCGIDITDSTMRRPHLMYELENGGSGSYHNELIDVQIDTKTITVPEKGHWETKTVKEAWTEQVLVKEAGYY